MIRVVRYLSPFRQGFVVHASHPFPTRTSTLCTHTLRRTVQAIASKAADNREAVLSFTAVWIHA